jgi:hypothetical protein
MHKFYVDKPQNWEAVYALLIAESNRNGVYVTGNSQSGSGSHSKAKGEFAVVGQKIQITVLKKPALVPKSLIESHVREYIRKKEREAA